MKKILNIALIALVLIGISSCKKEELDPTSIFKDTVKKKGQYTEKFDCWLDTFFVKPYNCEFRYQLDDAAMDPNYNVVPVRLGMADTLAHLALYLWYNAYDTVLQRAGDSTFLYENGPRMIQIVGSSMINAAQGTEKLGYAEGGIKITLMKINKMKFDTTKASKELLNEYVFKTMHHEFGHILHQKKTMPKNYESITPGDYDPTGWQYMSDEESWTRGFVSNYSRAGVKEDFVEVIANYIVKDDNTWNHMLEEAGVTGAPYIKTKWEEVIAWLADQWRISLYQMHLEVMNRQIFINYEELMKNNFDYHTYPNYDPSKEIPYDPTKDVIIPKK